MTTSSNFKDRNTQDKWDEDRIIVFAIKPDRLKRKRSPQMDIEKDLYYLTSPSELEFVRLLLDQEEITMEDVEAALNKKKKEYVLKRHKYKITIDKTGRFRTHYRRPGDPSIKRISIVKRNEDRFYSALYDLYTCREERALRRMVSLEEIKDDWLEYKRLHGISESTIIKYESDWKCHLKGTDIVKRPICTLKKHYLDEWAHKLIRDNNMTRKDYINVSTLIRQPLDYAVDLEIIDENPMRKIKIEPRVFKPEKKKPSETQVFTRDEVAALTLAAWEDLENDRLVYKLCPLAFLFMFQTGLRIGEVCTVRYGDIEEGELHLQRSVERDLCTVKEGLKGSCAERWVTLSSEALNIIDEARRRQKDASVSADGYIFSMTEEHLSYRAVSESFRKYCERAGISYRSSHKAHKTFISTLLDGGMNLNTVRELVGHKDEHTTLNSYYYDRRTSEEKREILDNALSALL